MHAKSAICIGCILISASTGVDGIIDKIRNRVGTVNPVYLSIDIDTLDPACEFVRRQSLPFSFCAYLPD